MECQLQKSKQNAKTQKGLEPSRAPKAKNKAFGFDFQSDTPSRWICFVLVTEEKNKSNATNTLQTSKQNATTQKGIEPSRAPKAKKKQGFWFRFSE